MLVSYLYLSELRMRSNRLHRPVNRYQEDPEPLRSLVVRLVAALRVGVVHEMLSGAGLIVSLILYMS